METRHFKNPWDAAKAVLIGKYIVIEAYLKEKKNLNLMLYLKELEKVKQSPKLEGNKNQQKYMTKINTYIQKVNELMAGSLKKN